MQKKYLIANIKIPMEISQDGKYESLTDYLTIDFIKCNKLPEIPMNLSQTALKTYKSMIDELFSLPKEDDSSIPKEDDSSIPKEDDSSITDDIQLDTPLKLFVNIDEIIKRPRNQNTSFKNKHYTNHNFSVKTHS